MAAKQQIRVTASDVRHESFKLLGERQALQEFSLDCAPDRGLPIRNLHERKKWLRWFPEEIADLFAQVMLMFKDKMRRKFEVTNNISLHGMTVQANDLR